MRNGAGPASPLCACGGAGYCAVCVPPVTHVSHATQHNTQVSPHVSHVSHVSPHESHESHVSPHESHVSPHESHVSPHESHMSHSTPPLTQEVTPTLNSVGIQATVPVSLAPTPTVVQRPPDKGKFNFSWLFCLGSPTGDFVNYSSASE